MPSIGDPLKYFTLNKKFLYGVGVIGFVTIFTSLYILYSLQTAEILVNKQQAVAKRVFDTHQQEVNSLDPLKANYQEWEALTESTDQHIANSQKNFLFLITFIFILMFAVSIFIIRSVSFPLQELINKTREISHGNLEARVNVSSRDELGELAEIFNRMAARLNVSHKDLEDRIQKRTQDLQKFRMAVESTSDHIVITDPEGKILYANKAAEKITGYRIKEMIGKTPALWGGKMPNDFYRNMWDKIKIQKKTFKGELNNTRKNGEQYTAEVTVSPVLGHNKEILFLVGIERDVTEGREMEKAKTEFVSLASHQLRTPLTSIKWYSGMLLDGTAGKLTPIQKQYVEYIKTGTERMVELSNKLLSVSRIELGSFITNPVQVNLPAMLSEIQTEFQPIIISKKISYNCNFEKKSQEITTDKQLLHVILQNLISNAVKYTPDLGTISISVHAQAPRSAPWEKLDKKQAYTYICVADNGYGIPAHQQDKIFLKFFRADNVHTVDTEGTGLGLYMSKAIAEHIGGALWFESEEHRGTTFWTAIPKKPPASIYEKNLQHELALTSVI